MSADRSGRVWAYLGIVVGAVVSIAANVAHSFVRPADIPPGHDWRPEPGAVLGATFWPIALLITTEIMTRTAWPPGRAWLLLRFAGLLPVAAVAGIVSYLHLHGLLHHYHEAPLTCLIAPLSVDGLMVMASSALVANNRTHHPAPPPDQPAPLAPQGPTSGTPCVPSASAPDLRPGRPDALVGIADHDTGPAARPGPEQNIADDDADADRCEGCRTSPATTTWTRPPAGHPYRLCATCATDISRTAPGVSEQGAQRTPARTDTTTTSTSRRPSTASRVARLAADRPDLTTADIARQVGVSTRTVRRHLANHLAPTTSATSSSGTGADVHPAGQRRPVTADI